MNDSIEKLKEKIELFRNNLSDYKDKSYDEYSTRADFIDSLFAALGWDMYNEQGVIEQFREVVREDKILVEGTKKAPDYSFRIGHQIIFYVEAKKPSVDIKNNPEPAYQLRRYAHTQGLRLSILTDFEEIAIYDSRIKPKDTDKAGIARIFYCTYDELFQVSKIKDYETNFDFLLKTFGKQAVLTGSFEKYAESNKNKKGTESVDKGFLKLFNTWRENLAVNIALKNDDIDEYNLNIAVQKIIDRLIFLRIAEDRLIEQPNLLKETSKATDIYNKLLTIFDKADNKYNSSLFISETWLREIQIEDKSLVEIIEEMYYPKCPYEFSVLPLEILGQAYEQFLGKTIKYIRKTKYGHSIEIEEKPEVRKAGGVYYTPQYIVNYIVEATVGEKIKKKKPEDIEKITVLDPACGSGSFLIGTYNYLIKYHLEYYLKSETQKKKALKDGTIYQTGNEKYKLSTKKKSEILVNNIYGVDIDQQAVEVTKLSLLLKVLEDENLEYKEQLFKAELHHLLPNLSENIKCGNSLIGSDFYNDKNMSLFDEQDMRKINTFDWAKEFTKIFDNGKFDCVIGNPPYGFHEIHDDIVKPYFKNKYKSSMGSFENYFLFYEKALSLLNKNGLHSFIVPVTWLTIPSADSLRKYVIDDFSINNILWLPEFVFEDAKVNTLISIISKGKTEKFKIEIFDTLGFIEPPVIERILNQDKLIEDNYVIHIHELSGDNVIISKIESISIPCSTVSKPCSGYNPYEVGKGEKPGGGAHTKETVKEKPYHSTKRKNAKWKLEIGGSNLKRYSISIPNDRWVLYGDWLAAPRDSNNFHGKRILVQEITGGKDKRIVAAYCADELYYSRDVIPIKIDESLANPYYLLGIINSKLISWYHQKRNPKANKGLFPKVLVSDLKKLPIPDIDISQGNKADIHNKIITIVLLMQEIQEKIKATKADNDIKLQKQKADILDNQIDDLVYKLYSLTDKEIKVVEGVFS